MPGEGIWPKMIDQIFLKKINSIKAAMQGVSDVILDLTGKGYEFID